MDRRAPRRDAAASHQSQKVRPRTAGAAHGALVIRRGGPRLREMKMGDIRQLAQEFARSAPAHLEFEQIASYAERSADAIDREIVESHIAHCPQCRREVHDLESFLGVRRRQSPLWIAAAMIAVAI